MSEKLDGLGEAQVTGAYFFATDHTHTSAKGAMLAASLVVDGIRTNKKIGLKPYLLRNPQLNPEIFLAPAALSFRFWLRAI